MTVLVGVAVAFLTIKMLGSRSFWRGLGVVAIILLAGFVGFNLAPLIV